MREAAHCCLSIAGPRFCEVTRGLLQRHSRWGIQVYHRQAPASYECRCSRRQRHAEVRPRTHQSTARRAALAGRSRAGAVQAVCNGPPMSTEQGTTVHERLLRPYLGHCLSATLAVRWLPSAACAATLPFDVRSSGLSCGRPGGLELVIRLLPRSDAFC